jgi:LysM repeat protein
MKCIFILAISLFSIIVAAQQSQPKTHTVETGNTLFSISKQYGISVDNIKAWNNLTSYSLKAGQVLIVSPPSDKKITENIQPEKATPAEVVPAAVQQETTTTTAQQPAKNETIEDLGFRVSELEALNLKSTATSLLPVKSDTAQNNLIFCGGIEEDKPVGISSVFFNNRGQNYVYVYVEKDTVGNSRNLIVDLFVKEENCATTKLSTTNYVVKPRWKYTIFKHFINHPGLYEIVVYDNNRKKLGDGQVRILP